METVELNRGNSPVILGLPHTGTFVPDDIRARLNVTGRKLTDTDWHVHELYRGLLPEATTVRATFHRYCLDANRDPSGVSLYPGQNTTGLCPTVRFCNQSVYLEGQAPTPEEVAGRLDTYWRPYHDALAAELDRLRRTHDRVVLWEGHSIRGSDLPYLFEGRLPDLNLGTANGTTCAPEVQARIEHALAGQDHYDYVVNGRFKGGYITPP